MEMGLNIHPSGPGLLCAAAAVVAGAPLFSHGLRAHRLRRQLSRLGSAEIARCPVGLVHVHGRVALEEPLRAPLSGLSCASFRLEIRSSGAATFDRVDQARPFFLTDGAESVRVHDRHARLEFQATAQRELCAGDEADDALTALLARAPEAAWARSAGATLHLVERALLEGGECHVIGVAHSAPPAHVTRRDELVTQDEVEWLRTGTDDVAWHSPERAATNGHARSTRPTLVTSSNAPARTEAAASPETGSAPANRLRLLSSASESPASPRMWIGGDAHDYLYISDVAPDLDALSPSVWHTLGAYIGPAVSLAGLSYLAGALDTLRSLGRP